MSVELLSYRLSVRGKPVGSHELRVQPRGRTIFLEGKMTLQGSLGQATVVQQSRVHRDRFFSFQYHEETNRRGDNRTFDVVFDHQQGVVKASKGGNDEAEIPYLRAYNDPLGLLYQLRHLGDISEPVRVPMLGKDVVIVPLGSVELDTKLGRRNARAYLLQPGGSYVYVDREPPHHILAMTQRLEGHLLDVQLVEVGEEADMPNRNSSGGGSGEKKRRRSRRRRRRPRKRQS